MTTSILPASNSSRYKSLKTLPPSELPHTFTYLGFDEKYFPKGTVAVAAGDRIWVTKIQSTLETCSLVNRLLMYIIKTNRKNSPYVADKDVRHETLRALLDMVNCATITVYETRTNKNINSIEPQIKLMTYLRPDGEEKPNKVIQDAASYLRFYQYKVDLTITDYMASINSEIIAGVAHENILVLKKGFNSDRLTIAFLFSGLLYLTNILANKEAIEKAKLFVPLMTRARNSDDGFANTHQVVQSFMNSIALACKSEMIIRPAYFSRNPDGTVKLRQRQFLTTERKLRFEDELVTEASNILLSINATSTR